MGAPKLKRVSSEEYQDAPDWFRRFLDTLNPFLGDVSSTLGGGSIGRELLRQQVETFRIDTESSLTNTFTNTKVAFKNKLGVKPVSVRVGQIYSRTAAPVTEEAWNVVTAFSNGWLDYISLDGQFGSVAYMKDSLGWVHMRGLIHNGTLSTTAFTLPVGYRPEHTCLLSTQSNGVGSRVDIGTGGAVVPHPGSNVWVALNSLSFRADLSVSPDVQWEALTNGLIRVNYIPGLGSNRSYDVTLIIE